VTRPAANFAACHPLYFGNGQFQNQPVHSSLLESSAWRCSTRTPPHPSHARTSVPEFSNPYAARARPRSLMSGQSLCALPRYRLRCSAESWLSASSRAASMAGARVSETKGRASMTKYGLLRRQSASRASTVACSRACAGNASGREARTRVIP
jgi:hypothetical protein